MINVLGYSAFIAIDKPFFFFFFCQKFGYFFLFFHENIWRVERKTMVTQTYF